MFTEKKEREFNRQISTLKGEVETLRESIRDLADFKARILEHFGLAEWHIVPTPLKTEIITKEEYLKRMAARQQNQRDCDNLNQLAQMAAQRSASSMFGGLGYSQK